jgi:FtsP/CotA-like multicopper oxidase with cupredoxin domain
VSRRSFVESALIGTAVLSVGGVAGSVGVALSGEQAPSRPGAAEPGALEDHSDHTAGSTEAPAQTGHSAEEMDRLHKEGLDAFLRNQQTPITAGKGNLPLQPEIVDGVKVFRLTVDEVRWETQPGKLNAARGYNGAVPGPILRATQGETVRVIVTNNLTESTTIHWHGLFVPNNMDGVPFINQEPIKPGQTFTYEFRLRNSGTHMYHSHHNSMDQVNRGLLGAFIVDPADPASYPRYDREYIMVLNDLNLGFTINGKSFPATDALTAKLGERVLIRYMNEGVMNHPMHLHGMPQLVVARDGWPVNPPYMCDTVDVAPGNRYDVIVEATEPGTWAFHCHVLSHAEGPQGMFGLVTAMIVT